MKGSWMEGGLLALALLCAYLGFLALPVSESPAFDPGRRPLESIRVLTWNVGGSQGPTGRPLAESDLPIVSRTLRELSPDLAFLQELAGLTQLQRLVKGTGRVNAQWALTSQGDRRVAVIAWNGSLQTQEVPTGGRPALAVLYRTSRGEAIGAVVLHADAYSARRRNQQVGRAWEVLSRMPFVRARMLAGDFNLDLDQDKKHELFSDDVQLDLETYNFISARLLDAGLGTGSTALADQRLDYLFVDRAFHVLQCGPVKGRRRGNMDHDPLVADLTLALPENHLNVD